MPVPVASLYEQLYPLTTVMKQRMVETFTGKQLNTHRWGTQTSTGGTYTMKDEVDGGFEIATGTANNHAASIGFAPTSTSGNPYNTPRQYSHTGSVIIFVQKWTSHVGSTSASTSGFHAERRGDNAGQNGCAAMASLWNNNFLLRTCDGNHNQSNTDTTVTKDNVLHSYKIELTSSYAGESIDGALQLSHTTNLPEAKMSPVFGLQNHSNQGASSFILNYVEAYNT